MRKKMDDLNRFDSHVLISLIQDTCRDSLLNQAQKDKFIETEILDALLQIKEDDLPALRAAWKMSRWP